MEAQKEIDAVKAEKESIFLQYQQQVSHPDSLDSLSQSSSTDTLDKVNSEAEESLVALHAAFHINKDAVTAKLLETVRRVVPVIHV